MNLSTSINILVNEFVNLNQYFCHIPVCNGPGQYSLRQHFLTNFQINEALIWKCEQSAAKAETNKVKENFLIRNETDKCVFSPSLARWKRNFTMWKVRISKCLLVFFYDLRSALIVGWQIVLFWSQVSQNTQCQVCYSIRQVLGDPKLYILVKFRILHNHSCQLWR